MDKPLFATGVSTFTVPAMHAMGDKWPEVAEQLLARHRSGDWGDVSAEDKAENDGSPPQAWG